jgi:His/Glu/Gln/Arg/opine family amino acid ABC transporter permease subunit
MIEFLNSIQNSLIYKNFFLVLSGLDNTILLLLISLPLGFVLAVLFALGRVSKITLLSRIIASYIFVIRGTPLLVQIYLIYFGLGSVKFIRESFFVVCIKRTFLVRGYSTYN